MCARTTCHSCGKPTWRGCGQHVEQALMGIPKAERCPGHARTAPHEATMHPQRGSFLSRLFGGE